MEDLPLLTYYICGNINADYFPNKAYYWQQYNYVRKLSIVYMWKQKRGLPLVSRKGDTICNDQLINFYKYKEHKNCRCSTV